MKKNIKSVLRLGVFAAAALSLAACGSGDKGKEEAGASSETEAKTVLTVGASSTPHAEILLFSSMDELFSLYRTLH